ncbi:chaplin family protein [Streptomyces sp. NBC_00063]|uniref:chaplin family protein n=1 Tax=Streptomyces sp. NBC_00063 TaxID=2975638 RepID=UPI003D7402C5
MPADVPVTVCGHNVSVMGLLTPKSCGTPAFSGTPGARAGVSVRLTLLLPRTPTGSGRANGIWR